MLVLEHTPVYTLGRSAKAEDVKFPMEEEDTPEAAAARGFDVRIRHVIQRALSTNHPPTHLSNPSQVFKTDRGGQVTWHGPGQVVVYPIIDLTHHKKDLRWYVRGLEEVVLKVLGRYGIKVSGRVGGLGL